MPGQTDPSSAPQHQDALQQLRSLARDIPPARLPAALRDFPATRPASVLILFSPRALDVEPPVDEKTRAWHPDDLNVLLQLRAATLRDHAGQVSFPGGRREPADAGPEETALREAAEETGVDPSAVEVLARLSALPLPASDHLVTPVIGWWPTPTPLQPIDRAETSQLWQMPVSHLLDPASRFTYVLERSGTRFTTPAFDVDGAAGGAIIWGFTAMVLDGLFDAVGWAVPWDRERTRTVEG